VVFGFAEANSLQAYWMSIEEEKGHAGHRPLANLAMDYWYIMRASQESLLVSYSNMQYESLVLDNEHLELPGMGSHLVYVSVLYGCCWY
jgi:hypothetical protein